MNLSRIIYEQVINCMFKKIFYLLWLLPLTNCSTPGTAFLGPIFTGAKTGSIYQTSLSYSTGKIMNEIKQNNLFFKSDQIEIEKSIADKSPIILLSYAVDNIMISDVLEPEPLP